MLKRVLTVFFLMTTVVEAFADPGSGISDSVGDIFTPAPLDLSINYLRMIFGTVGNVLIGGGDELIAQLFGIFNAGLLVFVGGFVSYTVFRSVINTSQDGGMGGQGKGGNAWTVFRIVLGVSLLVPMYQGYSMAQVMVMWSVKQGVGLADTMWSHTADHLSQKGGAVMSPPTSNLYDNLDTIAAPKNSATAMSMQDLMRSAACLAILDNSGRGKIEEYQRRNSNTAGTPLSSFAPQVRLGTECKAHSDGIRSIVSEITDESKNHICFGTKYHPTICGAFNWKQDELQSVEASVQVALLGAAENYLYIMKNLYDKAGKFYDSTHQGDFSKALNPSQECTGSSQEDCAKNKQALASFSCNDVDGTSANFVEECLPGIALVSGATHYYSAIKPARVKPDTQTSGQDKQAYTEEAQIAWADQAKAGGWITAGQSYHHMISRPNQPPTKLKALSRYMFRGEGPANDKLKRRDFNSWPGDSANPTCRLDKLKTRLQFTIGANQALNTNAQGQYTLSEKGMFITCAIFSQLEDQYQQHAQHKINIMKKASLFGRLDQGSDGVAPAQGSTLDNVNKLTHLALKTLMNTMAESFTRGAFEEKAAQTYLTSKIFEKEQPLNIAPQNIKIMLTVIISNLLGIQPYTTDSKADNGLQTLYNDGTENALGKLHDIRLNPNCKAALAKCNAPATEDTCFKIATENKCIRTGEGILGAMYSAKQGSPVDQVLLITNLGTSMLNNAVQYWTSTINGIYTITKAITADVTTWILTKGTEGAVAGATLAAMGSATSSTGLGAVAGVAMSAAGGAAYMIAQIGVSLAQMYYKFDIASLGVYLPFGASLAAAFFGMGITMGIYVPLIPFLTFLFSAIGWLIAVIEAMIAAPLVALGVTHPEGHDLLGKAEQSVMLLLGIFIRPAAMLLGFIMAVTLSYVAMEMLNIGFISVMLNYMTGATGIPQMIGFCGILLVYTYVAVSVIQQTFSMIYLVPEKLLRWIGVQEAPMGVGQMMGEVKGGASQAGGQAAGGASQAAGSPPQMSPASMVQSPKSPDLEGLFGGGEVEAEPGENPGEGDDGGGGGGGGGDGASNAPP